MNNYEKNNKRIISTLGLVGALSTAFLGCGVTAQQIKPIDPNSNDKTTYNKVLPRENIEQMGKNSAQMIEELVVTDGKKKMKLKGSCSGTVLYDHQSNRNHFLTAEHCMPPEGNFMLMKAKKLEEKKDKKNDFDGYCRTMILRDQDSGEDYKIDTGKCSSASDSASGIEVEILEKKVRVKDYEAEIIKRNELHDLALLKLPTGILNYFDGKLAKGTELGDLVAGVTYPGVDFPVLFTGFVAGRDGNLIDELFKIETFTVFNGHIYFGSSGGGVYTFEGKEMYLAGVVQVKYRSDGLEGMAPIKNIRKFFVGTNLEDELLGSK
ncbi:MAG: serine protease [Nanoarchaeota archaeon]|nr:serine protease [Nanoarchaeota archaeon]MBU1643559.1 serine protease [Nanoarchaeota archaeon]MBU1976531.1 serine protease [Nanoarchaeota archaeon]